MVPRLCTAAVAAILLAGCGQHNETSSPVNGGKPTGVRLAMAAGPAASPVPETSSPDADQRPAVSAEVPNNDRANGPTIPAGTHFRVRLQETLNTKYCHPGEAFAAVLEEPVVVGRNVVIPRGAAVRGHVTSAQQSGRLKGRAYLGLVLDSVQVDGRSYAIATNFTARASSSHKKRNLEIIGGGTGGGAAIGAIAGGGVGAAIGAGVGAGAGTVGAFFTGRKQVVLPVETELVFSLRRPVTVRG